MNILFVSLQNRYTELLSLDGLSAATSNEEDETYSLLSLAKQHVYHFDAVVACDEPKQKHFPRWMRSRKFHQPLMMLMGYDDMAHRCELLEEGADEVMTFSFDKREFQARLEAIIRRFRGRSDNTISFHGFTLWTFEQELEYGGQHVHLPTLEMRFLSILAERKGHAVNKTLFMELLYPHDDDAPDVKILDVVKCNLQRKLRSTCGHNIIEAVWGRGYLLSKDSH